MKHGLILICFICLAAPASAKIYKCGNSYSATPCGNEQKELSIGGDASPLSPTRTKNVGAKLPPRKGFTGTEFDSTSALCKPAVLAKLKLTQMDMPLFAYIKRNNSGVRRIPHDTGQFVNTSGVFGWVRTDKGGFVNENQWRWWCFVDYETETKVLDIQLRKILSGEIAN